MSLYVERFSIIHHIDPINKLTYIVAAIVVPIILPSITAAVICTVVSLSLLLIGKVFKQSFPVYGFVLFVLLTVVIIQGLFNPANENVLFTMGPVTFYREGLLYALAISLRVINIVGSLLLLVLTTKPSDLVESLVRRGLSPRIGYVLGSVFQIVPQMMTAMRTITDAQRSRGMETEGNLLVRVKAFLPLIVPVVLHALISVKERAMALEVRGFNSTRTKSFLNEAQAFVATRSIQWSLWGVIALTIVWRVFIWQK